MKIIYSDFDGLARTNGRDIEINSKYKDTPSEKLFIYHEDGHILLDHFKRQKDRELGLWNVATDLEIAIYLYPLQEYGPQMDMNKAIQDLPELKGLIYWKDPKYEQLGVADFHIAEDIYEILKKKIEEGVEQEDDGNSEGEGSDSSDSDSSSNSDNDNNSSGNGDKGNSKAKEIKEMIEKAIETTTKFHGTNEFNCPEYEKEDRESEEGVSPDEERDALNKIGDAVASCQMAREVEVKKLKINSAITNSVNLEGRGTLGFKKTYSRPCRSKAGLETDRIYRGERVVETKSEIFLFVDRSGSFDDDKTRLQEQAVEDLARKFRGRLKIKTLYFTTDVFEDKESIKGWGTNIYSCFQYIEKYKPSMSIIITDDDSCYGYSKLDLKKSKVGFIFIGCENNSQVTDMATEFNSTLINRCN